jgi:hypothetical protein
MSTTASNVTTNVSQLLEITTMTTPTNSPATSTPAPTTSGPGALVANLSAMRLSANYGSTLGVTKLLTKVMVGKAKPAVFFRAHPDEGMTFPAMVYEDKEAREQYLVTPSVAQELGGLVRPVLLCAAIDRQNNPFLIPVPLPGEDGNRNPWHESLAQAVEHAKKVWLRISANMHVGAYDIYVAEGTLPEPVWSAHDMDALVQVAFRGKIITSLDHPVVQSMLGRV